MSTAILACRTIEAELQEAMHLSKVQYPLHWIASGLHENPHKLQRALQEKIDELLHVENILLAFGYCGNALQGIKSATSRLVLPRIDDCISLLLGSANRRRLLSAEKPTYFFTAGWLDYEKNLVDEYNYCVRKYGARRGRELMKRLLHNYERFIVIDTGAYDHENCLRRIEKLAQELQLEREVVKGSLSYLQRLLLGPWDQDFIVAEPGEELTLDFSGNY